MQHLTCFCDTDVIKRTGVINLKSTSAKGIKIASGLTDKPAVLHGSCISEVQLTEIATGRVLYTVGNIKTYSFFNHFQNALLVQLISYDLFIVLQRKSPQIQ